MTEPIVEPDEEIQDDGLDNLEPDLDEPEDA